jgi:hypothetical protein
MTNFTLPSCYHLHQIPYNQYLNCTLCGTILSSPDPSTKLDFAIIKDNVYNSRADISPAQLYASMLKEQNVLRCYNPSAKYVADRKELIYWLRGVNSQLHLSRATLHIAITYMDFIFGREKFVISEKYLVALTCLLLAAKYDELDKNIPSLSKFLYAAKIQSIRNSSVKKCEAKILNELSWNLRIITPLNFLELLLTQGVIHESDGNVDIKRVSQLSFTFIEQALESNLF